MSMKLIMTQNPKFSETEVEIRYAELNDNVRELAYRIEQYNDFICGIDNGRQYRIHVCDIFYVESVDKKTFIYTKDQVFRSELRLYQLLDKLKRLDFIQVSKSCIVNINVIESLKNMMNSRLEATLINEEKIAISRTFLPQIKMAFLRKEEES